MGIFLFFALMFTPLLIFILSLLFLLIGLIRKDNVRLDIQLTIFNFILVLIQIGGILMGRTEEDIIFVTVLPMALAVLAVTSVIFYARSSRTLRD